ncbi:MAG: ribonuclease R [Spirochaetes bacterium]|nr:ribonuclease R [Spirochaetota bacterium]
MSSLQNEIFNFIKTYNKPARLKKIYSFFKRIPSKEIDRSLSFLVKEDKIKELKGQRYTVLRKPQMIKGRLSLYREGFGFVDPLEGGQGIYIPSGFQGFALPGDIVECSLMKGRGKTRGKVETILQRGNKKIVARVHKKKNEWIACPIDKFIRAEFKLSSRETIKFNESDYIVLEVGLTPSPKNIPPVRVVENLGQGKQADLELVIRKYDFPLQFPEDVLQESRDIPEAIPFEEIKQRTDLRNQNCFTIDGEDAKDFDDAVAVQKVDGNFRLFVHIADVAHYVKPKSLIDRFAYQKATSVYFPHTCLPMLPEKLSNNLCSLKPNVERLTMTCEMLINQKGDVYEYSIYPSIIQSKARLTYRIAQRIIDNDTESIKDYPHVHQSLQNMKALTDILIKKRYRRGSIDFDLPEAKIIFDEAGTPIEIEKSARLLSHRMIEEFMILANETVARYMEQSPLRSIYRVHEPPNPDKVRDFQKFITLLGINIKSRNHSEFFQKVIKVIEGRSEETLVNYLILRTMAIAKYASHNIGHFGLGSSCYTHFTSPIRRYADLTLHRLLKAVLEKKTHSVKAITENLDQICDHTTEQSTKADEAEREVILLHQLQLISKETGNIFEGIITNITNKEMYIELSDNLVKGYIPLSEIEGDRYKKDPTRFEIKGRREKKAFRMGERILARLMEVDLANRRAKFQLVGKSTAQSG